MLHADALAPHPAPHQLLNKGLAHGHHVARGRQRPAGGGIVQTHFEVFGGEPVVKRHPRALMPQAGLAQEEVRLDVVGLDDLRVARPDQFGNPRRNRAVEAPVFEDRFHRQTGRAGCAQKGALRFAAAAVSGHHQLDIRKLIGGTVAPLGEFQQVLGGSGNEARLHDREYSDFGSDHAESPA